MSQYTKKFGNLFRDYWRIAGGAGVGIMGINILSPTFMNQDFDWINHPITFAAGCMTKGILFGIFWPAIPIKLATKPRELVVFGSGIKRWTEYDGEFTSAQQESMKIVKTGENVKVFKNGVEIKMSDDEVKKLEAEIQNTVYATIKKAFRSTIN